MMLYPVVVCSAELALKLGARVMDAAPASGTVLVPRASFPIIGKVDGRIAYLHWPVIFAETPAARSK